MYIDLTHTFNNQMPVFPGDVTPVLEPTSDVNKDGILDHQITTGMHVGTHMDAPAHIMPGGKYLSDYPPEKFFGRGVLIDVRGKSMADIGILGNLDIRRGDIVLVCFGWSTEFEQEEYYKNYPEISEGLAKKLCELGISIVGMDSPSPDRAPYSVHKILFKRDILIIENLTNLDQLIGKKDFEVIALPAKLQTEAASCRVVAKI